MSYEEVSFFHSLALKVKRRRFVCLESLPEDVLLKILSHVEDSASGLCFCFAMRHMSSKMELECLVHSGVSSFKSILSLLPSLPTVPQSQCFWLFLDWSPFSPLPPSPVAWFTNLSPHSHIAIDASVRSCLRKVAEGIRSQTRVTVHKGWEGEGDPLFFTLEGNDFFASPLPALTLCIEVWKQRDIEKVKIPLEHNKSGIHRRSS